ncbi:hypothetical protein [Bradyrhizobium sp. 23AC]
MTSRPITDYDGLIQALRDRRDQLDVGHEVLCEIGGLQSGYVSKLLAPRPMKNLGPVSFGALLGALGVAVIIVEDPAAVARVRDRWVKRKRHVQVRCVANDRQTPADDASTNLTEVNDGKHHENARRADQT